MRAGRVLVVSLLLASMAPGAAFAQPAPASAESADDLKRRGDEAMIALRYVEALEAYKKAYEATKNPALLYNMGRAYEGLNDFPKALDSIEEFSEKAPPELKARVPKLQQLLADLRAHVAMLVVSCEVADAEIRLGDRLVGKTRPGQTVIKVNAGPQHLRVTHEDYRTVDRDLQLAAGKLETVDLQLRSKKSPLLRIDSPVSGAQVTVDGRAVGVVPAEAPVEAGSHRILLKADGYEPAETNVVVMSGEEKQVTVPMATRYTVTKQWWFWTAVGVAVVAGGVATYIVATTEKSPDSGTIPPGQVKAALHF